MTRRTSGPAVIPGSPGAERVAIYSPAPQSPMLPARTFVPSFIVPSSTAARTGQPSPSSGSSSWLPPWRRQRAALDLRLDLHRAPQSTTTCAPDLSLVLIFILVPPNRRRRRREPSSGPSSQPSLGSGCCSTEPVAEHRRSLFARAPQSDVAGTNPRLDLHRRPRRARSAPCSVDARPPRMSQRFVCWPCGEGSY